MFANGPAGCSYKAPLDSIDAYKHRAGMDFGGKRADPLMAPWCPVYNDEGECTEVACDVEYEITRCVAEVNEDHTQINVVGTTNTTIKYGPSPADEDNYKDMLNYHWIKGMRHGYNYMKVCRNKFTLAHLVSHGFPKGTLPSEIGHKYPVIDIYTDNDIHLTVTYWGREEHNPEVKIRHKK